MLKEDFLNAIQSVLLLRVKLEPGAAATLMSNNASKLDLLYHEGYAPIEAVSSLIGRELSENFDIRTGEPILNQLTIDPATGEPYVVQRS